MTERRKYTARTKAKAVGIAMVDGVTAAERATGIPKTTIQQWKDRPEYVQLRTTARDIVAESMWVGIQVGVEQLVDGLKGNAPLHHKASAFQALADRYALLTGGATSRTEARDITGTITDAELSAAILAAESITAGSRSPQAGEDAPEG